MATHSKASAAHGAASEAPQFDPWILWVTFRRCWPWAVPSGAVLAGIVAYIVVQGFVPTYKASHLLEANTDFVVFKGVMPVVRNLASTEKALIFNSIVIDPVLGNPTITSVPSLSNPQTAEANLRKNLKVHSGGTKTRLVVSFTDPSPTDAATVCNTVVDSYLRQRDSFDQTRVNNLERWLNPEIQRWEQEVEERQQRVHTLSEKAVGYAPGQVLDKSESASHLKLITKLRGQINTLKIDIALMDVRIAGLKNASQSADSETQDGSAPVMPAVVTAPVERVEPSNSEIEAGVADDPLVRRAAKVVSRYRGIILDIEVRGLTRISKDYYAEMQSNLSNSEKKLEREKRLAVSRVKAKLKELADEDYERRKVIAQKTKELQAQQAVLVQKQKSISQQADLAAQRGDMVSKLEILQKQHDEERQRLERFGGVTAELQFSKDELEIASDVLTKLRNRVAAIRTERRQDGAVRTLAVATPPKAPVEKLPVKKLAMFSSGAFLVPFLFGLLWEYRVQRITDAASCERKNLIAPVVGEVARLPTGYGARKGRRVFEESIDTLRSNLLLSVDTSNTRSIAITSSMSGEGKSSVASQLALSMAKASGKTVLLVDGDLRRPDQHDIFGVEMGPGLSSVLAGTAKLDDAIDRSLGDLLHLLPAGKLISSPHRLMSPSRMKEFVEACLKSYDYVVFDTAPILSAGETLAIAPAVDATLVCVMRDVSRMDHVTRSTRRLEAAGATVAGTVFSGVTPSQYSYRYGNYHYALAAGDV